MKLDKDDLIAFAAILFAGLLMFGWLYTLAYRHDKENQRPIEEKLRTEEFRYKGHQYIKFETNRTFDGMSVVHDPNCDCFTINRDSII